jgi:Flp pilus assembly protein TadD
LLKLGEPRAALVHLEKAVSLNSALAPAHFNRGLAYEALGRPSEAARAFGEAWRQARQDASYALAYGRALIASGKPEQAVEPLSAAQRQAPDVPSPLYHLGYAHLQTGRFEGAATALASAAALAPNDPQILLFHGIAARRAGRASLARSALEKVRSKPESTPAQQATAAAELGLLALSEGRDRDAAPLLEQALAVPGALALPDRTIARLARGEALLRSGLFEDALSVLEPVEGEQEKGVALLLQAIACWETPAKRERNSSLPPTRGRAARAGSRSATWSSSPRSKGRFTPSARHWSAPASRPRTVS